MLIIDTRWLSNKDNISPTLVGTEQQQVDCLHSNYQYMHGAATCNPYCIQHTVPTTLI